MAIAVQEVSSIIAHCDIGGVREVTPVHGGDINEAFCIRAGEKYFLKVNKAISYPGMFENEAKGLRALEGLTDCLVPTVVKAGVVEDTQYLLLTWINHGPPSSNFWELFGRSLAELHKRSHMEFGLDVDNYIGTLPQNNRLQKTWAEFYGENRIMPLVKQLRDNGAINDDTVVCAEKLSAKFSDIFPIERPSLLHGDLWSGNFMVSDHGTPCIYDPAIYYGHREMDLGMTKLFGGFHSRFYSAYDESFPLESSWLERVELTQLYPLLVHAILFGGSYIASVARTIKHYS